MLLLGLTLLLLGFPISVACCGSLLVLLSAVTQEVLNYIIPKLVFSKRR